MIATFKLGTAEVQPQASLAVGTAVYLTGQDTVTADPAQSLHGSTPYGYVVECPDELGQVTLSVTNSPFVAVEPRQPEPATPLAFTYTRVPRKRRLIGVTDADHDLPEPEPVPRPAAIREPEWRYA
jgi:hypothetical protein